MKKIFPIILILTLVVTFLMHGWSSDKKTPESLTNSIGQKFVYIKPGSFMMGSNSGGLYVLPVHKVTLTRGFYMQTTEVTQGQWHDVMKTKPWSGSKLVKDNRNNPAVEVSWEDTKEFIKKLNLKEEVYKYRLPTEAEWEYACRAGSSSKYSFGDSESQLGDYAWVDKNAKNIGEMYAHEVATKKPNPWGLYDMHGNVWERCENWYDPMHPYPELACALRGGGWNTSSKESHSANNYLCTTFFSYPGVGFRLVFFQYQ